MTEHAPPLALRIGLAAFAAFVAASMLNQGSLTWTIMITATAVGLVMWAITYIGVYVLEQWLYETGRLTRPYWMTGKKHPVDEMKEIVNDVLTSDQGVFVEVERGPAVRAGLDDGMIGLLHKLATPVLEEEMTHVSMRALEAYGIAPRSSPEAIMLMDHLIALNLMDDVGNSRYAVTERLKSYLVKVTGAKFYDKPVRADTPQMA